MKKIAFILFCTITFVFLNGCQDVVQVELDEGSEMIVIDAFLQSKYDLQAIFISKSTSFFGNAKPVPVTNASATLYDRTNQTSYKFYYNRENRYQVGTPSDSFIVNHEYELEVFVEGIRYSAKTTQPRGASIDSISSEYITGTDFTGKPINPHYECTLWAKDKVDNNPDYYWIKAYGNDTNFINVSIDGTGGIVKNAGADSLYFSSPYNKLGFQQYSAGQRCVAEVHAITKETYSFLVQVSYQLENAGGGLFAKTPENVKTNFITPKGAKTKAVGWFSVATVVDAYKDLPK